MLLAEAGDPGGRVDMIRPLGAGFEPARTVA
jgi:hypothetical protein